MGRLTESLTRFITESPFEQIPKAAVETAIDGFTDATAVLIAGSEESVTQKLATYARSRRGPAESRMLLSAEKTSTSLAALVGTGSAHALDYDDYAYSNHVSALLVPALLAEADRSGASGKLLIEAYLVGFEVWGALFKREPDHLHSKGWHPTGVFGPIGVAAALSRLRGLDAETCRSALGLAATSGAGVMDNFGTEAKPYQGARAAEAGVVCVELAMSGLQSGPNAIDGSGGLLAALSPNNKVDLTSPPDWLGKDWIAGNASLNIKRYPTVGASQRAIDAAIQLHTDHAPDIASIERVTVHISERHDAVMRFKLPQSASEARFSLEFGVAAGLISGSVNLAHLHDDYVRREDVQNLMKKVIRMIGPDDDPSYPVGARYDMIRLENDDGSELLSKKVYRFLGHGENPMSEDQLKEKFFSCAEPKIGLTQTQSVYEALRALPDLGSERDIPTLEFNGP